MNLYHWLFLFSILCSLDFRTSGSVFKAPDVTTEASSENVISKWENIEKNLIQTIDTVLQQLLPMVLRMTSEVELSSECMADLLKFVIALRQGKLWAFQMVDASGKPFSGLSTGTLSDPGAYRKCLSISAPSYQPDKPPPFVGQYCSVDLRPPLPPKPAHFKVEEVIKPLNNFTHKTEVMAEIKKYASVFYHLALRFGVCLPSTCTKDDVSRTASLVAERFGFYASVPHCEVLEELSFDAVQITILCVFGLFLFLVMMSTAYHVIPLIFNLPKELRNKISKDSDLSFLLSFSLLTNSRQLFSLKKDHQGTLFFLNGVKFFSMAWVLLGHTYLNFDFQLIRSPETIRPYPGNWAFQAIGNGLPTVDTFIFVSGLLVSYVVINTVDQRGRRVFNIPIIIMRRYWRLVPMMLLVASLVILLPQLGSGPVWHENMDLFAQNCRRNWWAMLTMANNFLLLSDAKRVLAISDLEEAITDRERHRDPENVGLDVYRHACLPFTWYVSVDMQLFVCAIIFLVLVFRKPMLGGIWCVFLILVSVVSTGAATYAFDLPPTQLLTNSDPAHIFERTRLIANLPHQHAGVYAIGLVVGYILARHPKISFPKWGIALGWCLSVLSSSAVIYGTLSWNRGRPYGPTEAVFYAAFFRPVWALALTWMTLMCAGNTAGFVKSILSWPVMKPLGKLTYLMYLLHFPVMYFYVAGFSGTTEMDHKYMFWTFSGHLVATLLASAVFYLIFEGPLSNLDRLVVSRVFRSTKKLREGCQEKRNIGIITGKQEQTIPENCSDGTYSCRL